MARGKPKRERRIRQQKTGAVFYNASKDRWQGSIELPPKEGGKRSRKTYTARAVGDTPEGKAEVERQLASWQGEYLAGTLKSPSRETVRHYLEDWVTTKTDLVWGERMALEVPDKLRLYVYDAIGAVRLNDLTAEHINRVFRTMARTVSSRTHRRLSKQTMLHVHRILHSALRDRVDWGAVEVPTVRKRRTDLPAPEVISELLSDALAVPHGMVFVLMAATAMRTQEVLGLRRSDLNFERGTVTVNEVMVTEGANPLRFKGTKTEESQRTIELPPDVCAVLRAYCEDRAALQLKAGRVFCSDTGAPLPYWWLYPLWRRLLAARGVPYFRPYDLRHFTASWWLDEGIPLAVVSAALGHSTQRTTAGIYSHMLRRSESRIAQASGKLLKMGKPGERAAE